MSFHIVTELLQGGERLREDDDENEVLLLGDGELVGDDDCVEDGVGEESCVAEGVSDGVTAALAENDGDN